MPWTVLWSQAQNPNPNLLQLIKKWSNAPHSRSCAERKQVTLPLVSSVERAVHCVQVVYRYVKNEGCSKRASAVYYILVSKQHV